MKSFIILVFLFSGIGTLSAQEIKVTVMSDGTPLEYANCFINNDYYDSSDSTGFVSIRRSDISAGDTISISFVGMNSGTAIYNPDNYTSKGIAVTLTPNLHLEEVVVVAKDTSIEMLKKHVKDRHTTTWFMGYHGDYRISQQNHNEIAGSFVFTQFPDVYATYYKLNSQEITSTSDTTGRSASIKKVIRTACNASLFSVQLKKQYASTQEMHVKYMGKDNCCYVFLLTKPALASLVGSEDGFQTIIYADVESGEIVFAKTTLLYSDGQIIEFAANYANWKQKSTIGGHIIYPTKIEGSIAHENIKTHFVIENIKISRYKGPKIHRKDR